MLMLMMAANDKPNLQRRNNGAKVEIITPHRIGPESSDLRDYLTMSNSCDKLRSVTCLRVWFSCYCCAHNYHCAIELTEQRQEGLLLLRLLLLAHEATPTCIRLYSSHTHTHITAST